MSTNTKPKPGRDASKIAYLALSYHDVQRSGLSARASDAYQAAQHRTFCKRLYSVTIPRFQSEAKNLLDEDSVMDS